ncbi:GAF domain-containing protein [Hymenobacter sp. BT770]|uniref:GAF domain-containing protein n=1 Tax=Hymenobacter sp. BT770 TaxID=2886942 RepID=UPI001D10EF03|nr:GAF domain-containing protein [Hymenobacter sp. BT770]MCC3152797.1 GAF domain-containing protein [Hymenobacter sp. BT770]MDO3414872.1 GAF domain-containing protein [Hymenobacter sp. BT770]
MIAPGLPANEPDRLRSLAEHNLLDTLPEEVYDDITRLAAEICGTPIAAINLIAGDRLWPKSAVGFERVSSPREESFCAHAILNPDETMVVSDARYDERFFDNPNIATPNGIVFYAGVPVQDAQGRALGSLCVADIRAREIPEHKMESLQALAELVNTHFQLRRTNMLLTATQDQVKQAQPILHRMVSAVGSLPTENEIASTTQLKSLQEAIKELQLVLEHPACLDKAD